MAAFAIIILTASSPAVFLFGFWVGRCAGKLPVIDNNLPWTMHREQGPHCAASCMPTSARAEQRFQIANVKAISNGA